MKAKRTRRLRPARVAGVAAASILLAAAALLLLVRLGTFDRLILAEASRRLEATAGLVFEAARIDIDPFRLSLSLRNVAVRAAAGRASALRKFTAESIDLEVPFSLVFGGQLRIRKVRVGRPEVVLAPPPVPPEGSAVPPQSPSEMRARPTGFDLRIDDFEIDRGRAFWKDEPGAFGASLEGIDISVRYDAVQEKHVVSLTAAGGRLAYAGRDLGLERLDIKGRFGPGEIEVDTFEIATKDSSANITGTVKDYVSAPEFSGRARLTLAVSELPLPDALSAGAEGIVSVDLGISGKAGGLTYEADVSTTGLRTRDLGAVEIAAGIRGTAPKLPIDLGTMAVSGLDVRTEAGIFRAAFTADLKGMALTSFDLEWKSVDLDRLPPLRPFLEDLPVSIGSLANGRLSGKAESLSLEGISASLALAFVPRPEAVASPDQGKPPIRPAGEIRLRASGGAFALDKARLSAAGISLDASGTVRRNGRLDGRYALDVDSIPTAFESLRLAGLASIRPGGLIPCPESVVGAISVAGSIGGRLDAPSVIAEIDVPELKLKAFRARGLRADLQGDPSKLVVRSLEGFIAGGTVRGSGTISLTASSRGLPRELFSLELEGVDLAELSALMPEPWDSGTAGRFTGRAEIATGAGGVSADFSAKATELALGGLSPGPKEPPAAIVEESSDGAGVFRLSVLEFSGSTGPSRLEVKEFIAGTDTGSVSGKGSLDLGNRVFSAQLLSSGFDLEALTPLFPPGLGLGGRLTVDLDAGGDLEAPRGVLNLSVTDLRAGELAVPAVELQARCDGRSAEAALSIPAFATNLDGKLSLTSPHTFEGKIVTKKFPLDRLMPPKPEESATTAVADGAPEPGLLLDLEAIIRGAGDLSETATLEVDGEISRLLVNYGTMSISNPAPIRIRFDRGTLRLDSLSLTGSAGSLTASGTAGPFPGKPTIAGRVSSDIDLTALSPFVPGILIGGRLKADIDVRGEPAGPDFSGRAVLAEGFVRPEDFPLTVNAISGEISFEGSRLEVAKLEGTANGGSLRISGGVDGLFSPAPPSGRFSLDARNLQLEYPLGLHTTSDISLTLAGEGADWTLAGTMKILRGLFRENISPGGYVLGLSPYRSSGVESELPEFIRGIRLDIAVSSAEAIVVRNNLADLEILADVRVSGNPGLPVFSGRLRNDTIGTITFGDRRFSLETIQIDLLGQTAPDPNIELVAYTNITHNSEPLDIRLQLSGPVSDLTYSLTSTPPRSKEDLSLIILTGRSLEEVRGSAVNTLTGQTLRFFSSPIASPVTGALERLLKVEQVSFVPLLDSSETDPGARFTFRKRVSEQVDVTYSIDISSTQNQTWIVDYKLRRHLSLQAFGKDDGSYGASFRHSIPIELKSDRDTGVGRAGAGSRPILSEVAIEGDPKLRPGQVNSALRRLKEGKPFSYARLSAAVAKLIKTYKKTGFPNADIRPTVTPSEDGKTTSVHLLFLPGDPGRHVFSGDDLASKTRKSVKNGWTGMFPEDVNLGQARSLILKDLHKKGYYDAEVEAGRREGGGEILYEFTVRKGSPYKVRDLEVKGNAVLPAERIKKALPKAPYKGLWSLVYDPRSALTAIAGAYRKLGYSDVRIRQPEVVSDPAVRALDIGLTVSEGRQRMVRAVSFESEGRLPEAELRRGIETAKDKPFDPALLPRDRDALLALCRSRGFRKAEIKTEVLPRAGEADVDIVFKVREGEFHTVSGLEVAGTGRTQEALILRTARIKKGDAFSFESLAVGQKNLYDLGVFRAVNISAPESAQGSKDVPVVIDVQEEPPLTFMYGLRYNSEEKLEGQVGLTAVNLLGHGRTGYIGYRRSSQLWDARISLNMPYLFGYRADTRFSLWASRESREAYISEEYGASVGQEIDLRKDLELDIFYNLSRVHDKNPEVPDFGPWSTLSETSLNFVRDNRDDRFDATSGTFLSLSLTGAPKLFGADVPYAKLFSQYSFYMKAWRGVYWASNVRFGAITEVGVEFPASRLFYAGGGTSLRGFEQDRVGPISPLTGLPTGGRFIFLLNEELRIPLFPWFSGVVFYDLGNVYATAKSLARLDLRQGIGAGLRVRSPIGLIRFDCGFNPFPRSDEPKTVLFLSIGQAF